MKYVFLLLSLIFPYFASAELMISEIMYDSEGTDAGVEWLEIYNNGGDAVDVSSWHFFENNVHHGLFPENFKLLEPGAYAVIVQDSSKIKSIFGNTNFIKSSFSLSNEGESLALSDPDKKITDTLSYTVNDGANGNGKSLQRINNLLKESMPTFGKENTLDNTNDNNDSDSEDKIETSLKSKNISSKPAQTIIKSPYYKGKLDLPNQILAQNKFTLKATIEFIQNERTINKKGGTYYINFGDGSFIKTESRIETTHRYEYPGNYEIVFEYYSSSLNEEIGNEPEVLIRKEITVFEPQVLLSNITTTKGIRLFNELSESVNISGWTLKTNEYEYIFPKYSFIPAQTHLFVPYGIHKLDDLDSNAWVWLRTNEGVTISSFTLNTSKLNSQRGFTRKISPSDKKNKADNMDDNLNEDKKKNFQDYFQEQHPEKSIVDFGEPIYHLEPYSSQLNENGSTSSLPEKIAIGSGIIATLLGLIRLRREPQNIKSEEKDNTYDIHVLE
jgi:hypothetical protein